MSKLTIDQKTIFQLFSDKKADFLIPDYQRPYAWEKDECSTLWENIFDFAFPDNDYSKFNKDDEYFLGPIVTFKNNNGKLEVIDGQQRLTTIMLMLRAFYERFGHMQDENSKKTRANLEKTIWKTDEFGTPDKSQLKIDSEVAADNDKNEFLNILKTGMVSDNLKSRYAENYRFFQEKIDDFLMKYPSFFSYLPIRILNNCIVLPIEAESQDTALRIFSTLNDRGKPLSDADIFKAQLYTYYSSQGEKDSFIARWKDLENLTNEIFAPITGTPMDELFTRYMYFERAKQKNKLSTTEALRKFYEKGKYAILKKNETFSNLELLAKFWEDVSLQSTERFNSEVLRCLYVLNYAPNGMWTYFVSVYFMQNKDSNGLLDNSKFTKFLTKITAFIFAYAITNPGVNALRTPVYAEMVNIIEGKDIDFNLYKFDELQLRKQLNNFEFKNNRPITKSILTWWVFNRLEQPCLSLETTFEIEHIYSKKRYEIEHKLADPRNIESIGNKSLLEKRINIRVSDYRFTDKTRYYIGFTNDKGQKKNGTNIVELVELSKDRDNWTEEDIIKRHDLIINSFIIFLRNNNLLK